MNRITVSLASVFFIAANVAEAVRGVAPNLKTLYTGADGNFDCLDGSQTIPFNQVNDDYCDCQDGSDEPGTSACPNGFFYCLNEGHVGRRLPSSRVGDLICDCCDGSDEWEQKESHSCPNTCEEVGRAYRERRERMAKIRAEGAKVREQRIEEAKKQREQLNQQLNDNKADKSRIIKELEPLEAIKTSAEEAEKAKLDVFKEQQEALKKEKEEKEMAIIQEEFNTIDTNGDSVLTRDEVEKAARFFDIDGDNEVSEDEADIALDGAESLAMDAFPDKYRDALNRAAEEAKEKEGKKLDEPIYRDEVPDTPIITDPGLPEDLEEEHEDLDVGEGEEEEDDDFEQDSYNEDLPKSADYNFYDEETKAAVDAAEKARNDVRHLKDQLRDKEVTIKAIEKDLSTNFGKEGEYFSIRGKCVEFEDRSYTYKVCLFESATQSEGSIPTHLGRWDKWADELDEEGRPIMLYTNGVKCWNGPHRSTRLAVQCGLEDRLLDFSEPNKCEYAGILETPSACDPEPEQHIRDEL